MRAHLLDRVSNCAPILTRLIQSCSVTTCTLTSRFSNQVREAILRMSSCWLDYEIVELFQFPRVNDQEVNCTSTYRVVIVIAFGNSPRNFVESLSANGPSAFSLRSLRIADNCSVLYLYLWKWNIAEWKTKREALLLIAMVLLRSYMLLV